MEHTYDDNYSTCKETSAVFRIIHPDLDPADVTATLQLVPSRAWPKGEPVEWQGRPARTGMWMLDTEGNVLSRDVRRHLDWLIAQLHTKQSILAQFRSQGYKMDVFCHWIRLGGTGGPTLSPANMLGLANLGLTLGFEFWSEDEEDEDN